MPYKTSSQSRITNQTAKTSQTVATGGTGVSGPTISSIVVTDSGYNNLDDTAAPTSNSFIKILGTGFSSTANVYLNGSMVPKANITFVSSTELRAVLPVSNTGNYTLGVFNSNSAGALYSSSFAISSMPQWLTSSPLAGVSTSSAFSFSLSATSDSSITYSNTTALPAGTTLLANGYFYGTVSSSQTYTFDVKATDAELQDTTKTFSLTSSTNYTTLLITGNTGVVDETGKNTLTLVGNTRTDPNIKKYGVGSIYLDGSSAIYLPSTDGYSNFGTGNFTVEFWIYPTSGPNSTYNPTFYSNNGNGAWDLDNAGLRIHHQNTIIGGGSFTQINHSPAIQNNVWSHYAVVRNGNTVTVYINGNSVGSASYYGSVGSTNTRPIIGCSDSYPTGREFTVGYFDDIRISKAAIYTTNFTPPSQLTS